MSSGRNYQKYLSNGRYKVLSEYKLKKMGGSRGYRFHRVVQFALVVVDVVIVVVVGGGVYSTWYTYYV